jgi:hypothetical protein
LEKTSRFFFMLCSALPRKHLIARQRAAESAPKGKSKTSTFGVASTSKPAAPLVQDKSKARDAPVLAAKVEEKPKATGKLDFSRAKSKDAKPKEVPKEAKPKEQQKPTEISEKPAVAAPTRPDPKPKETVSTMVVSLRAC